MLIENEIPKYKKKAVHITPKKSNHEHLWSPIIIIESMLILGKHKDISYPGKQCDICGKIKSGFPKNYRVKVPPFMNVKDSDYSDLPHTRIE